MADRVDHRRNCCIRSHDLKRLFDKTVMLVAEYYRDGEYGPEELIPRTGLFIRFTDQTELLLWDTGHGLQVEIGEDMTGVREK